MKSPNETETLIFVLLYIFFYVSKVSPNRLYFITNGVKCRVDIVKVSPYITIIQFLGRLFTIESKYTNVKIS